MRGRKLRPGVGNDVSPDQFRLVFWSKAGIQHGDSLPALESKLSLAAVVISELGANGLPIIACPIAHGDQRIYLGGQFGSGEGKREGENEMAGKNFNLESKMSQRLMA